MQDPAAPTNLPWALKDETVMKPGVKLKDEINNLNSYIESRKSESSKLESALAKKHNDYNDLRKQRDELQEERKYKRTWRNR